MNIYTNQETYDIEQHLIEVLQIDLCVKKFNERICPLEPIIPKFLYTIRKDGIRKLYEIFTQLSKIKYCD